MNLKLLSFTLIALLILPLVSQAWAWDGTPETGNLIYNNDIKTTTDLTNTNQLGITGLNPLRYFANTRADSNITTEFIRLYDFQCNVYIQVNTGTTYPNGKQIIPIITFSYNNEDYVQFFNITDNQVKIFRLTPPASGCSNPTLTLVRTFTPASDTLTYGNVLGGHWNEVIQIGSRYFITGATLGGANQSSSGLNLLSEIQLQTNPLEVKVIKNSSIFGPNSALFIVHYTDKDVFVVFNYDSSGLRTNLYKVRIDTTETTFPTLVYPQINDFRITNSNYFIQVNVNGPYSMYDYDGNLITSNTGQLPKNTSAFNLNNFLTTNTCKPHGYYHPISPRYAITLDPTECKFKVFNRNNINENKYRANLVRDNPVYWYDVCYTQQDSRTTGLLGRSQTFTGYYVWNAERMMYAHLKDQNIAIESTALTDKNITLYNVDFDKYKYLAIVYEKNMYFYFPYFGTEITSQTQAIKVKQGVNQLLDIVQILKGACTYKITTYVIEGNSANVNITLPTVIDFQYAGQYGWEFSLITNTQAQITLRTTPSNHTTINPTTINIYNQSGTLLQTNTASASLGTPVNINYTPASSVIYRVVRVTWNDLEGKERNVYFYWYNTSTSSTDYFTNLRGKIKGVYDNFASRIGIGSSTLFYLSLLVFIPPLATRANLHIIMIFITAGFLWGFWTYGAGLVTEPFLYIFAIAGIAIAVWNRYG